VIRRSDLWHKIIREEGFQSIVQIGAECDGSRLARQRKLASSPEAQVMKATSNRTALLHLIGKLLMTEWKGGMEVDWTI